MAVVFITRLIQGFAESGMHEAKKGIPVIFTLSYPVCLEPHALHLQI